MTVGVLVGRFQPFHNGHLEAVRYALKKVDYLYIVIGSSQKSHERDNPFTAGEKPRIIKAALDSSDVKPERWMAVPIASTDTSRSLACEPQDYRPSLHEGLHQRRPDYPCLKEQGMRVEAVPYLERSSYSADQRPKQDSMEMKQWEKLVPEPVASMVKSIGGVERVRSMIHKDLEGEG